MESLEENILVIGLRIKNMEEELYSIKMETDMMDIGLTACLRAKAEWYTQMRIYTKVNGMKEKGMDMEYLLKEMETTLKAIGSMTWERVKAVTTIMTRINYL